MKENDWIVAGIKNPNFSNEDFKSILGLTEDNTQMLSLNDYKNSKLIQDTFKTADGSFDDAKFELYYAKRLAEFNKFNSKDVLIDNFEYSMFDTRQKADSRIKDNNFSIRRVLNPDQITMGISGRNAVGERLQTPSELAQTLKIFDPSTGKFSDETPNDKALFSNPINWVKQVFEDPLVMAVWEENGTHIDPFSKQEIEHKKGEYKLNDEGLYFYEKLNGRSPIGKEVLSSFDILTVDGSTGNKYDFLDSDGLDKSVTGSIAKAALTVAPLFIPYVREVYAWALVGRELSKAMPMLYGMASSLFGSEQDSAVLNTISAVGTKFSPSTSEYAKQHVFAFENFANLMAEVATQWGQQKAIANAINHLRNTDAIINKATQQAAQVYRMESGKVLERLARGELTEALALRYFGVNSIEEFEKIGANWSKSPLGKAAINKFLPAAEEAAKKLARLGADAALAYMAIVSNTDVYDVLILKGASKRDAALVAFGSTLGMFGVDKYLHLGEMFFDNLTTETNRVMRATFRKEADAWGDRLIRDGITNPSTKSVNNWINKGLQFGRNTTKKFTDGLKYHSLGFFGKALGEGLEEVSEEIVTDISKQLYEIAGTFKPNFFNRSGIKDVGAWDNVLERYAMNFLGGFAGGGIFYGVDVAQKGTLQLDHSKEDLIYLVRNHRTLELLHELDQWHRDGKLGDKNLSSKNTERDDNGNLVYITAKDGEETLNDFVYHRIKETILQLDNILNENGLNLSEDELFLLMVLKEDRFMALQSELLDASYSTGYQEEFSNMTKRFVEVANALKAASDTYLTDSLQRNEQISNDPLKEAAFKKLLEEFKEIDLLRLDFLEGRKSFEYTDKMLFAIDPFLRGNFISMTFDEFLQNNKGKTFNELSPEEQSQAIKDYIAYRNSNLKLDLTLQYEIYKKIKALVDPHILNLTDTADKFKQVQQDSLLLLDKDGNITFRYYYFDDKLPEESEEEYNNRSTIQEGETEELFKNRKEARAVKAMEATEESAKMFLNKIESMLEKTGGYLDPHFRRRLALYIPARIKDIKQNLLDVTLSKIGNLDNKILQDKLTTIFKNSIDNFELASKDITAALTESLENKLARVAYSHENLHEGVRILALLLGLEVPETTKSTDLNDLLHQLMISVINNDSDVRDNFKKENIEDVFDALVDVYNNAEGSEEDKLQALWDKIVEVDDSNEESLMSNLFLYDEGLVQTEHSIHPDDLRHELALLNESETTYLPFSEEGLKTIILNSIRSNDDFYQQQLSELKNKLDNNNVLHLLEKVAQSTGKDFVHDLVSKVTRDVLGNREDLNEILERLYLSLENVSYRSEFVVSDMDINAVNQIQYILRLVKSYLYAASTRPNYNHPVGHNAILNDFASKHKDAYKDFEKLPELSSDVAAMAITTINSLLNEVDLWIQLSRNNQINKSERFKQTSKAWKKACLEYFNKIRDLVRFELNGKPVDLLDGYESISDEDEAVKLHKIENLFYINLHRILKSGITFKQILEASRLKDFFVLEDLVNQKVTPLNERIKYDDLTSYDKLVYLLTISGISANDFEYHNKIRTEENASEQKKIAPLTVLQYITRIAMAKVANPTIFNDAIDYFKEAAKIKIPIMDSIVFVDGGAGVGKSLVVARNVVKYFEKAQPAKEIWLAAPQKTLVDTLKDIVGNGNIYLKDNLFLKILDSATYARIKEIKASDSWIKTINTDAGDIYELNTSELKFNDDAKPGILIVDEGTHFSSIEWQVLNAWAKNNNTAIIVLGDTNQNGYNKFSYNIQREVLFTWRSPKLLISLRDVNIQKQENLAILMSLMDSLKNLDEHDPSYELLAERIKNQINYITLKVYNQETINGDLIVDSLDELTAAKLYDDIAYVGDPNSQTLTLLKSKFGDKVKVLTEDEIQGLEFTFIVIDKNWTFNQNASSFETLLFLQKLYTLISRGKVGSIIIDNGLTNIISHNKLEFNKALAPNLANAIEPFKLELALFLSKLDLKSPEEFDSAIKGSKLTKTNATALPSTTTEPQSTTESSTPSPELEPPTTDYTGVADTELEPINLQEQHKAVLDGVLGNELDNLEVNLDESLFVDPKMPIRIYGSAHLSGLQRNTDASGKTVSYQNPNVSLTKRDLQIFVTLDTVAPNEMDSYVRKLLDLKSYILYKHTYSEATESITKIFSEEDLNNIKYKVEIRKKSDLDTFVGYTGLLESKMDDEDGFIYTLVADINGKGLVTLGLLANPETYEKNEDAIARKMAATIEKLDEGQDKLTAISNLDNLHNHILRYKEAMRRLREEAIKNSGYYSISVNPKFSALTYIRRKTSNGNDVPIKPLDSYLVYDRKNNSTVVGESFKKSHPYSVISDPYIYIGAGFRGISDANRGNVVVFVSNDTLLRPDLLLELYLNSKIETNTLAKNGKSTNPFGLNARVRMLVLDPTEGITFLDLTYTTKLKDLFKTEINVKGTQIVNALPFEEDYMGARMYASLWNWRANINQLNDAYEQFKRKYNYSDDDVTRIALASDLIYRKINGTYLEGDETRVPEATDEEVKTLSDFNNSLANSVRLFRIGGSLKHSGVYIGKLTNINKGNPFYDPELDNYGIYMTPKALKTYLNITNTLFNVLDLFILLKDNSGAIFDSRKLVTTYKNAEHTLFQNSLANLLLEAMTNLTVTLAEKEADGTVTEYEIALPGKSALTYVPLVLTHIYLLARNFAANGELDLLRSLNLGYNKDTKTYNLTVNYDSFENLLEEADYDEALDIRHRLYLDYFFGLLFHGTTAKIGTEPQASDAYFRNGFYADPIGGTSVIETNAGQAMFKNLISNPALFSVNCEIDMPVFDVYLEDLKQSDVEESKPANESEVIITEERKALRQHITLLQMNQLLNDIDDLGDLDKDPINDIKRKVATKVNKQISNKISNLNNMVSVKLQTLFKCPASYDSEKMEITTIGDIIKKLEDRQYDDNTVITWENGIGKLSLGKNEKDYIEIKISRNMEKSQVLIEKIIVKAGDVVVGENQSLSNKLANDTKFKDTLKTLNDYKIDVNTSFSDFLYRATGIDWDTWQETFYRDDHTSQYDDIEELKNKVLAALDDTNEEAIATLNEIFKNLLDSVLDLQTNCRI